MTLFLYFISYPSPLPPSPERRGGRKTSVCSLSERRGEKAFCLLPLPFQGRGLGG